MLLATTFRWWADARMNLFQPASAGLLDGLKPRPPPIESRLKPADRKLEKPLTTT